MRLPHILEFLLNESRIFSLALLHEFSKYPLQRQGAQDLYDGCVRPIGKEQSGSDLTAPEIIDQVRVRRRIAPGGRKGDTTSPHRQKRIGKFGYDCCDKVFNVRTVKITRKQ